jgi:hypothetical protein
MPAGRRGHKIREFQRRIDTVLEKEEELRRPAPPPISAEHAALREKIIEEWRAIEWDYSHPTAHGDPLPTLETHHHATAMWKLMLKEQELLARHGVDYRPNATYDLS